MSLFERAGAASGAYPPAGEVAGNVDFGTTNNVTFYMADNLRGIGTSTTAQGKNSVTNAPSASLGGYTCVTFEGKYKYASAHTGEVGVKYRFYLGQNLINDYNIRRGYAYALTITVSGANSADLRVSITDGNVVVFDRVTEIDEITIEM